MSYPDDIRYVITGINNMMHNHYKYLCCASRTYTPETLKDLSDTLTTMTELLEMAAFDCDPSPELMRCMIKAQRFKAQLKLQIIKHQAKSVRL